VVSGVREPASLVICSLGRPSLVATVAAACAESAGAIGEVVLLDDSRGRIDHDVIRDAAAGVPCRILTRDADGLGVRSRALDAARHDLLLLTDDDCLPAPDWAARLVDFMVEHPDVAAAFGRVDPSPRPGAVTRVTAIPGVGEVAWGEAPGPDGPVWCPAISVPSWSPGIVDDEPTVPWARVGASNNLALRRSRLLPGRPIFLPMLGPGTRAGCGEDTELGYALMAAGRPVAYVPDARMLHDSWLPAGTAARKRWHYFQGNTEALGLHAMSGDARAASLLGAYWRHFCEVNGFAGLADVLGWAYGPPPA
jgi:GT2 family glycosyltransferase